MQSLFKKSQSRNVFVWIIGLALAILFLLVVGRVLGVLRPK